MSQATRTLDSIELPSAGTWTIDTSHSSIEFTVRHLMVGKTKGRFATWSGALEIGAEPSSSSVRVQIDPASIDTKDESRDTHLRSADFFDVDAYPEITFTSTGLSGAGRNWVVTGDLAIRGVTRPVELDVELEGVVQEDPWGFSRVGFSGSTEVNRDDFGLTWNQALEAGGVLVGKSVKINLEIEAVKQG